MRVADIGYARDAQQIQTNVVRVDGQRSVYIPVLKQGGDTNTISVVDGMREALTKLVDIPKELTTRVVSEQNTNVFAKAGLAIGGLIGNISGDAARVILDVKPDGGIEFMARSSDGGSTWEQVFATQDPGDNAARTEFALNQTQDGHTRIYVGDGGRQTDAAFPPHSNTGVYRADAVDTKTSAQLTNGTTNPGYVVLTDPARGRADPTYNYCEGQCWYDNFVV